MNLPASASSFMTPSCCRCRSISLHTINIQMKFLSVLSKASRHRLFSQFFFPLQTLNTSSSIFYSNQSRSSFSLPTKSIFFPSFYFWLLFLSRGAWILFYTPLCLHLHWSGNKNEGPRDASLPCRATNHGDACHDSSVPAGGGPTDAGWGRVHVNASPTGTGISERRAFSWRRVFSGSAQFLSLICTQFPAGHIFQNILKTNFRVIILVCLNPLDLKMH